MARSSHMIFWGLLALCVIAAGVILLVMPAEKTLGWVIKIVYLHGALSRAGMLGLLAAGISAVAYLVTRRSALARWMTGLLWSGVGFWIAHFVVSMPATRLTWGPWIAWGEPRVTMTLQVAAAGLIVILVNRVLGDARFSAAATVLLAAAVFVLAARTGVLRHPLDPIGSSPSALLRAIYFALLIVISSGMALVAWRFPSRVLQVEEGGR